MFILLDAILYAGTSLPSLTSKCQCIRMCWLSRLLPHLGFRVYKLILRFPAPLTISSIVYLLVRLVAACCIVLCTFLHLCRSYPFSGSIATTAFLQASLFGASFVSSWYSFLSLRTLSIHFSIGLPRCLFLYMFSVVVFFATFLSSLLNICTKGVSV